MLREMWKDYPASQLAVMFSKLFRREMTRNSIIGRARRIGLPRKGPSYANPSSFHYVEKTVEKKRPHANAVFVKYEPPKVDKWAHLGDSEPVTLTSLNDHMCHFPVDSAWNEPAKLFCGRPNDPGCPYCKEHRALAYNPVPPKSQRAERLASVVL